MYTYIKHHKLMLSTDVHFELVKMRLWFTMACVYWSSDKFSTGIGLLTG